MADLPIQFKKDTLASLKPMTLFICMSVLGVSLITDSVSWGQTRQDAGTIFQQMQPPQESLPTDEMQPALRQKDTPAEKSPDTGETVDVTGFTVEGNTQLTQAEINTVLAPYQNRKLNVTSLHDAAHALTKYYHAKGFFAARVFLPPHVIEEGQVKLYVVEGYLEKGGLELENPGGRIQTKRLLGTLEGTLEPGSVLTERNTERGLLLINDLPGISAAAILSPGQEVGAGRLKVVTSDQRVVTGNLSYDNFGGTGTGDHRGGVNLNINSPTGHGELLQLHYLTTGKRSNYAGGDLSVPLGYSGLRVGAAGSYLYYNLGNDFNATQPEGSAINIRSYATYPIIRQRHMNLYGLAEYEFLELDNDQLNQTLDERTIHLGTLRLYGNHLDNFMGGGSFTFNASTSIGSVNLSGFPPNETTDGATAETAGGFARFNAGVSRLQRLVGDLSALVSFEGQISTGNLDTSQQFSIGGPFSVPGYPIGEAYGDAGFLVHSDVRYDFHNVPWKGNFQVAAIYAAGWIKLHEDPWNNWQAGNTIVENKFWLQSAGVGVSQTWKDRAIIRAVLGRQIGSNPNRNPITREDSDFTDSNWRFWIQTAFFF